MAPQHFEGVTVQPMIDASGYELIVGSTIDPQFGPVLLFGLGGQLVEVFRDRALGLPPLTTTLARRMMERTRIHTALKGVRGRDSVDLAGLEQLLVRFSQLVVEQPWIAEIDINPLLASPERLIALDARVILHPADTRPSALPRPAIRPYPLRYVAPWIADDGTEFLIRPIRPEDEAMMVGFHRTLSEDTVYARYFAQLGLDAADRARAADADVLHRLRARAGAGRGAPGRDGQDAQIVAVGRLSKIRNANDAEFAILVSDPFQHRGIGRELLQRLIGISRDEGLDKLSAQILRTNRGMLRLVEELGFSVCTSGDETVCAEIALRS